MRDDLPPLLGLIESTDSAWLFDSVNGGRDWTRIGETGGFVAWPAQEHMYLVTAAGEVLGSEDGGRRFDRVGEIDGEPAAFLARSASELHAALHDGTIKRSSDGGATSVVRSTP